MTNKLSKEQQDLLLEYAEWYDSYLASPEELVAEFIEYREKETT